MAAFAGSPRWSWQADGLHELSFTATHCPSWARLDVIKATEMQESMQKVICQFMLRSPVVSHRLANCGFTTGNDFTHHSEAC